MRGARPISCIFGSKAGANVLKKSLFQGLQARVNVLKGPFSADSNSNCVIIAFKTQKNALFCLNCIETPNFCQQGAACAMFMCFPESINKHHIMSHVRNTY